MDNGLKIEIKIIYNAPKSKLKKIEKFEQDFQKSDQKYLLYMFSDIALLQSLKIQVIICQHVKSERISRKGKKIRAETKLSVKIFDFFQCIFKKINVFFNVSESSKSDILNF